MSERKLIQPRTAAEWILLAEEEIARVMLNLAEDSLDYRDLLHASRDLRAALTVLSAPPTATEEGKA